MKRNALGKGLDALLPKASKGSALVELELQDIQPNPLQPRIRFEPEKLEQLAASLSESGVLQPIVVRRNPQGFEIVAGERRWRAAQKAGLQRIPAIIQDVSDEKMVELALVENIQRDELSPIEEGHAYRLMTEQFGLTQEEVARRVGRSRTAVTNTLRLLRLPKEIQGLVIEGSLSMGHARALLPLGRKDQLALARQIRRHDLSVRAVEKRAQSLLKPSPSAGAGKDPNVRAAEQRLEEVWKTRVEISRRGPGGRLIFHFHSEEELQRLFEELQQRPESAP